MQSSTELIELISTGLPDLPLDTVELWASYLVQLDGCHLYSVASPEKDKEEWLKERRAGIGGSEVAAIMNENHWNSPRQIWMSKIGMFDDKPATQSEAARWGNLLETIVATEWGERNNRKWIHIPVILQDDERSWLLANIDGFTLSDDGTTITGILEIKTTSVYNEDAWKEGPLPFHYLCQTNWYCGITRLTNYTIVCLVGGQRLYDYDMPFDGELFTREVAAADDFWCNYVQKGIEPKATAVDNDLLKKATDAESLPDTKDAPVAILQDEETERVVEAFIQIRDKMSAMKKIKDALQAQLRLALGDNVQALTTQRSIVMRKQMQRTCDFDKLAKLAPDLYAEVVKTSQFVVMDIK